MKFNEYQHLANRTDLQPEPGTEHNHHQLMMLPLMGLAGEVGELLTEHKKWLRDGESYTSFPERITEELGDLLWYLSNVATKEGLQLGEIAISDQAKASTLWRFASSASIRSASRLRHTDVELNQFQQMVEWADQRPQQPMFEGGDHDAVPPLFQLVGKTGALLDRYGEWFQQQAREPLPSEQVREHLGRLMWHMTNVASKHRIHLEDIANYNLAKIDRRWGPPSPQREHYALFDEGYDENERLPRKMEILIQPDGLGRTVTFVNGKRFGDPLTDNHYEDDGYRFHDIFHLSFASMLGWSPTVRALLRRKRKSNPMVDETEDGGRAMVMEEGISAFVFDYGARHNFLDGVSRLDQKLLRNIRYWTEHLEVSRRTEADWERAIVTGFQIWREVRSAGQGHIYADLETGNIWMADALPACGNS